MRWYLYMPLTRKTAAEKLLFGLGEDPFKEDMRRALEAAFLAGQAMAYQRCAADVYFYKAFSARICANHWMEWSRKICYYLRHQL